MRPAAPAPDRTTVRFELEPIPGASYNGPPRVSPDGKNIAYIAGSQVSRMIYVRSLDAAAARPLPGSEITDVRSLAVIGRTQAIFWSADSQSIAFTTQGMLKTDLRSPAVPRR